MNAISTALKDAGVILPPLNKRVWLWLHDHPGKTAKEITVAIKAKYSDVATQLNSMTKRGMVERVDTVKQQRGQGERARAYVYTAKGSRFELLPYKKEPKFMRPVPVFDKMPPYPALVPVDVMPASAPAVVRKFDIEACTLRELRALYVQLKELFE